ncbi:unnamed protein product [Haemonchus placei]|uniref:Reverse transcriptase domain-containing protein n=1 Tax=Haemonchus placei TaxID=6290 RepID=A0A0N4WHX3_HAEPC|nr:unnamed protein product [Haemonchus placei]
MSEDPSDFDNKFYKQKRGLAMGNRIAPVLAVIFLDHIEKSSLTSGILFYKRYIDDVFIIGTTEEDLVETLERLNSHDANITFTREDPGRDGFLPFLNAKTRISEGHKEHLWYRKSASSNILLHSRSAHPAYMKANVVRNLLKTKEKLGTRKDSVVDAKIESILESNGYFEGNTRTWVPHRTADGVSLIVPFVNDKLAREETQRLANLLPMNLPHVTVRAVRIGKYDLPAGTGVVPQISNVLYDKHLQVFPAPHSFNPSRFIDENGKLKKVEELIPFSIGKRQCLGEGLAKMELFLFIANLFNRFEVKTLVQKTHLNLRSILSFHARIPANHPR